MPDLKKIQELVDQLQAELADAGTEMEEGEELESREPQLPPATDEEIIAGIRKG